MFICFAIMSVALSSCGDDDESGITGTWTNDAVTLRFESNGKFTETIGSTDPIVYKGSYSYADLRLVMRYWEKNGEPCEFTSYYTVTVHNANVLEFSDDSGKHYSYRRR